LKHAKRSKPDTNAILKGILEGDRVKLAQAITLIESSLPEDVVSAQKLLEDLNNKGEKSLRIGITGVPGVGKSTFIESFGKHITSLGKKIAVLTVDPSSQLTKGSILGDKTRMQELARDPLAFIRPTASGNKLGGVAQKTREAMILCEAAGFEVIIIETVGVGQSEVMIRNMVDFFLLLMLAGAGDELQGIKKGIMEVADAIAITKADGDNIHHATEAQAEYQHALHLNALPSSQWQPKVTTVSALTGQGISDIWKLIETYAAFTKSSGYFDTNRRHQNVHWLHEYFQSLFQQELQQPALETEIKKLEKMVSTNAVSPYSAAKQFLDYYHTLIRGNKS
jgi:LAO/AO transport system kinase